MTIFGIALSLALCLISATLQNILPLRGFVWRQEHGRPIMAAQGVMTLVLVAGLLWSAETEFAALLMAGWLGGLVIGFLIAALRSLRSGEPGGQVAASSAPAR